MKSKSKKGPKAPKIVCWDIEILANLDNVMSNLTRFYEYSGLNANISTIISFGYKVLGDKKATCINAWDFPKSWKKDVNDDYEVVKAAYDVLHDADAIVTHYGRKFDLPFLNARLVHHGLPTIPTMIHIDTQQVARHKLKLTSNRLDTVAEFLGLPRKMENGGWQLWVNVLKRCPKACKIMSNYCKQDVEVLEAVYKALLPLIGNHPNMAKHDESCPGCGSHKVQSRGTSRTKASVYQRFQCQECGSWFRSAKALKKHANSVRKI